MAPDSLWCAEGFVPGLALYLGFGYAFVCVFCQFVEAASDVLYPNSLLHFCKWENVVPICIALALILLNWDLTDLGPGVQTLLQVGWYLLQ